MEEASNLQEGGIYGPSEGGGTPEASVESPADIAPVAVRGAPCTDQGDPVENPQVKPKFWLLPGDNTRDIFQNYTLPTLWGST